MRAAVPDTTHKRFRQSAMGINACGGKDSGFYIEGRGWASLSAARKETGVNMAVKREKRKPSLPWGDYATIAAMNGARLK